MYINIFSFQGQYGLATSFIWRNRVVHHNKRRQNPTSQFHASYYFLFLHRFFQQRQQQHPDNGSGYQCEDKSKRVLNHRHDKQAAVWCPKLASQRHGQSARHGRTDDAGRQHTQRIRSRKRDRSLRYKAQPHDIVHKPRLPFSDCKPVFKKCAA